MFRTNIIPYDVCGKDLTVSSKNRNENDYKSIPYIALDNCNLKFLRHIPSYFVQPNLSAVELTLTEFSIERAAAGFRTVNIIVAQRAF